MKSTDKLFIVVHHFYRSVFLHLFKFYTLHVLRIAAHFRFSRSSRALNFVESKGEHFSTVHLCDRFVFLHLLKFSAMTALHTAFPFQL
jgi:hypothetical protein